MILILCIVCQLIKSHDHHLDDAEQETEWNHDIQVFNGFVDNGPALTEKNKQTSDGKLWNDAEHLCENIQYDISFTIWLIAIEVQEIKKQWNGLEK